MDFRNAYHSFVKKSVIAKKFPNVIYKTVSKGIDTKAFSFAFHILLTINPFYKAQKEKSKNYFLSRKDVIEKNIDLLADEQSKKVYSSMIEYRCKLKYKTVNSVSQKAKHQYLDKVVVPCESETFVDVGAFFGESTLAFEKYISQSDKKTEIQFKSLVIEPDINNYNICINNLKKANIDFISENCAAGNAEGYISFASGLYGSSRVDDNGKTEIRLSTVDRLIEKNGIIPTYVKYDIEGFEREALKGTHNTIEKYKPRLAISIYHSDEDMVEIIQEIKNKYPFYKFYVRQYTGFFADTVLYCIP